ncbi:LptA/OstA family protein [Tanticharoenia sakaeratensis]|uniref:Organic solvent tolerance-like N-terminal domain-containing protein n=1 Tax=Tanticharoenia sakaeratensis NBRC 103193 TaxID=1231623 RepID=A0A0D6ML03_9PROT|nr:LptA/OstA family protein [Tanticharoenia sakaeratensis]GAN54302.1 hypothetical protein Tasa_017_185 [Tanticharoenia sakaeratensis NBRC 103193]GBQ19010.1 hypothetical protein AA103193_0882 [Tanticharoenia sakaeratensis NBRC 103193]
MNRTARLLSLTLTCGLPAPGIAFAQAIDMSHGQQVNISNAGSTDWNRDAQTVTFNDQARAVRGDVTVDADQLIAFLRKKAPPPGQPVTPPADAGKQDGQGSDPMGGGSQEIYRLQAIGHVHIYTPTDQGFGDKAVYDIDQATLVMTGHALKLVTPQDVLTARDVMEYHSNEHMSVGRGNATVTTNDGRRILADVLVGYSKPDQQPAQPGAPAPVKPANAPDPLSSGSSKLEKVYAWGHVFIRTPTETVVGDRGVYIPDTSIARVLGHVKITRGQNQINGAAAIVNMKAGLATMTQAPGARVEGLVVPNETSGSDASAPGGKPATSTPSERPAR